MKKFLLLSTTHVITGLAGIALGIYLLPILTAPSAPTIEEVSALVDTPGFDAQFKRDLKGSDFLHWGEGRVYVRPDSISFIGNLAPGPDYKLYLSTVYVETESDFLQHKSTMVQIGDIKTFDNFIVNVPDAIDISSYNSIIIWCESFAEFITAARYQ